MHIGHRTGQILSSILAPMYSRRHPLHVACPQPSTVIISSGEKCSVQTAQSPELISIAGLGSRSFDARAFKSPSTPFGSHRTTSSRRFLGFSIKGKVGKHEGLLVYTCRSSELTARCNPSAARSTAASSGIRLAPKTAGLKPIVEIELFLSKGWRARPSNNTWAFEGNL